MQTAAAFDELGLTREAEAEAVRGLSVLCPAGREPATARERDRLLTEVAERNPVLLTVVIR